MDFCWVHLGTISSNKPKSSAHPLMSLQEQKKTAKVLKLLVFSSFSFGLKCSWADSKGTQEHWWQLFLIVNTQLGSGPHGFSLAPGFLPSFASVCFTPSPAESSGCVGASSGLVPWTPLLSAETNDPTPSPAGPSGAAAGDWRSASPTLAAPTLASPTLASTTLTCPAPLPPCTTGAGGRFHRGTKIGAARSRPPGIREGASKPRAWTRCKSLIGTDASRAATVSRSLSQDSSRNIPNALRLTTPLEAASDLEDESRPELSLVQKFHYSWTQKMTVTYILSLQDLMYQKVSYFRTLRHHWCSRQPPNFCTPRSTIRSDRGSSGQVVHLRAVELPRQAMGRGLQSSKVCALTRAAAAVPRFLLVL